MISKIFITLFITTTNAFILPIKYDKTIYNIHMIQGKGFGGGEATRDPSPTYYDPNDSKSKQTAIFKAETYAEYRARINGSPIQEKISQIHEPKASVTYKEYIASRDNKLIQENVKSQHKPSVTYEQYIASRKLKQYDEYYVPYNPSYNRGQEFDN